SSSSSSKSGRQQHRLPATRLPPPQCQSQGDPGGRRYPRDNHMDNPLIPVPGVSSCHEAIRALAPIGVCLAVHDAHTEQGERQAASSAQQVSGLWARCCRMDIDTRFRYYFQHPWSRLLVAYLVTFFNFLIFAEDPVSHSQTEAHMIVVGNCFSFIVNKYPGGGWNVFKVLLWLMAIVVGLFAGKFFFHQRLFAELLQSPASYTRLDDPKQGFSGNPGALVA
ncbi:hypothetical protein Z043_116258, partial [Scleropages formosus]